MLNPDPGKVPELRYFPDRSGKPGNSKRRWSPQVEHEEHLGLASFETTFGVEVAGATLMASAPARPGERAWHVARNWPDEVPEQMAHFRNREGHNQERP